MRYIRKQSEVLIEENGLLRTMTLKWPKFDLMDSRQFLRLDANGTN